MIVKFPVSTQLLSVAVTVMVAVKGEVPLFVAVKAGMFPVPEVASPMEELLFVQLTEAPEGSAVGV